MGFKGRFSIFQLMMIATSIGALIAYFSLERSGSIAWSQHVLSYDAAKVPEHFEVDFVNDVRSKERFMDDAYSNGSEFYRAGHQAGWEACRYHFFRDFDHSDTYQIIGKPEQFDMTSADDLTSIARLAYAIGYNQCDRQLLDLTREMDPQQLRPKIGTHKVGSISMLVLSIVCFGIALVSLIPRSRASASL